MDRTKLDIQHFQFFLPAHISGHLASPPLKAAEDEQETDEKIIRPKREKAHHLLSAQIAWV